MGSKNPTRRGRRRGLFGPSLPWRRALVALAICTLAAASKSAVGVAAAADDASSGARASSSSSTSSTSSSFLPRDWGKKNIDAELAALAPTTPVLVEFYAHWCPTCQRFAPEFEKAAKALLEKREALNDIAVARVDCADEAATCVRFGVPHFPFIRFGSAADFLAKQSPALETFEGGRNGKEVAAWGERKARELIAKNSGNGGGLSTGTGLVEGSLLAAHPPPPPPALRKGDEDEEEDERPTIHNEDHSREGAPPPPPPHPPRFDEGDVLKATVLAFRYSLDSGAVAAARGGAEAAASLAALEEFSLLLSRAHPLPACREGSAEMLAAIRKLQAEKEKKEKEKKKEAAGGEGLLLSLDSLRGVAVCGGGGEGRRAEAAAWGSCASARADGRGRGYTCGLWSLFHAAAANLPTPPEAGGPASGQPLSGQLWASAVRGWVRHFFTCSECAAHFESMASAERGGSSAVRTADEAVLWAWRAHNRVNARLREEEARGSGSSGDGVHRKVQWPPRELCPRCRRRGKEEENDDWDEGEVLAFLKRYYGGGGGSGGGGGKTSTSSLGRRVDPGGGAKKKKKKSKEGTNPSLASLASSSSSKPASSSSSSTTSTAIVLLVVFAFVAFGIAAGARAAPRAKKENFL